MDDVHTPNQAAPLRLKRVPLTFNTPSCDVNSNCGASIQSLACEIPIGTIRSKRDSMVSNNFFSKNLDYNQFSDTFDENDTIKHELQLSAVIVVFIG